MAFFRTVSLSEPLPTIEGDGVYLRAPQMSDYSEWTTLREASRAFLTPWEPTWPTDDLPRVVVAGPAPLFRGPAHRSFLCVLPFPQAGQRPRRRPDAGQCRRGVAQAGSLGYWMGAAYARRGLMTGAVSALVPFAFGSLRLHRLEAACIPSNAASIRFLEKARLRARGLCARISLHQRVVAGPPAVRAAQGRSIGGRRTPKTTLSPSAVGRRPRFGLGVAMVWLL